MTDQPGAPSILWEAFSVLGAFSHRDRVLSLAEIARRSALPKSTAHRVLAMLLETGAVEQAERGYRLGLRMFSLGTLPPEAELREAAMVHLEGLHRVTGQTLHLAVLRGADVVGKALPAFSGATAEAAVLAKPLPPDD
jgi:DNA-binding IclR family transcriptional regulator